MARVEVSQSIGPKVVKSVDGVGADTAGTKFRTETYTVHSYQLITSGIQASTDVILKIYATNDDNDTDDIDNAQNFQVIAQYDIHGPSIGGGAENSGGIMYSDIWNFKYAYCAIFADYSGSDRWQGGEAFSVIEKHNP